ncbi:MAG: bifunctional oligoribonuclease/PAP phosphatase NrnA [Candidatus Methylacidiphilales bacterium]
MHVPFSAVGDFFRQHSTFVILSHVRPDGDAYGSTLGLGLCLREMGKTVYMYNEDGLTPRFHYMPGSENIQVTPAQPPADAKIVAVDTADAARLGKTFVSWNRTPDLNIDHHVSNPLYGELNVVVSDAPAASQVLYELLVTNGLPITSDIASNFFIGISTDTGSFRYRGTTTRTFEIAAALTKAGANPAFLAQQAYQSYPASRFRLLQAVLQTTQFSADNRIVWCKLDQDMYTTTGATTDDTEGLIEYFLMTETVEVAALLEVISHTCIRVSLRSRGKVNVSRIAAAYGGGGHHSAAGIRTSLPYTELESSLIRDIEIALAASPSTE